MLLRLDLYNGIGVLWNGAMPAPKSPRVSIPLWLSIRLTWALPLSIGPDKLVPR